MSTDQEVIKQVAECACGWQGKRLWPSPTKPCPRCGSMQIAPSITAPHTRTGRRDRSWNRNVNWDDD